MPSRSAAAIALLAILPAFAFAQTAPAIHDATVVQTDGWTHRHVTVEPAEDGASLRITRDDGASVVLPFASVAVIRDAAGNDVTYLMVPGAAPPPPSAGSDAPVTTATKAPTGPVLVVNPRLAFTTTLGAGLGYGSPSGDFYSGFEADRQYYADVRIATGPRNYLKFTYRSQRLLEDEFLVYDEYEEVQIGVLDLNVDIREYILTVGFLSHATEGDLLRAYGEVGLGWGDHVLKGEFLGETATEHEGRLLLVTQGGVLIPFGRSSNVGLDLGVSLTAKILEAESSEGGGLIFGIQAGLVVLFGRGSP